MTDNIAKALDVTPLEPSNTSVNILDKNKVDDYSYARGNLVNIIEKGNEALDGILDVAQMSQHPRSYEVVAGLIKTMADANKDLLELAKRKKDLEDTSTHQTINNNLFVGSTAELQKLIKQQDGKE